MEVKQIREEILSHNFNDKKLDSYLKNDFKSTVQAMLNALFKLMRDVNKNTNKINYLLDKLEETATTDDKNKLTLICKKIDELVTRIDKHLIKKDPNKVTEILNILREIVINSKNKIKRGYWEQKNLILDAIIFDEKDLTKIGMILNKQSNVFKSKESRMLFEKLLTKYLKLKENEKDAIYYFDVISLILASKSGASILSDKERYLNILKNYKKTKSIQSLIYKFSKDYIIEKEELERRYNISFTYPQITDKDSYKTKLIKYKDFLRMPSITIDAEGNTCHDDAISLYKNKDGTYLLRIDISSIPSLISYNSSIDKIACKRVETIYNSNSPITLYPPHIAYDQGSLIEGNQRYVISYFYLVDSNFDIIEDSFSIESTKTFITNNLSYDQVDILLQRKGRDNLSQMITNLGYIANKIDKGKSSNLVINSKKMTEVYMSLVNRSVSSYFKKTGYPFIYYTQSKIDADSRYNLIKKYLGKDVSSIRENDVIKTLIASYEKHMYSIEPKCNQALNTEVYAKVTNPLRLYPSALCEYIIYDILIDNKIDNSNLYKWEAILKEIIPYINERIKLNDLFYNEYERLLYKNRMRKK